MTFAIMNRLQVRKVVGVPLLAVGLQLFCGLQLYAQRANFAVATASKAEAGREALTDTLADVPGRVNSFVTFDVPGGINGTHPSSFNPAGAITGYLHSIVMGDGSFAEHLIDPITRFSFGDASVPGLNASGRRGFRLPLW